MAYSISISAPAERQFEQAIAYVAVILASSQAATGLADEYEKMLEALRDNPFLFGIDYDLADLVGFDIRKALVKGYEIFYYVDEPEGAVCIVAFLHGTQNASYLISHMGV